MALIVYDEIQQANNGSFPILDSNNIKGGVYSVSTIEERDAIPAERRKLGMLCYVENEDEYYKLEPGGWEEAKFGGSGIQMYTDSLLKELEEKNDIPNEYIHIPNPNELNIVQNGSSYLDIIFKTLRALLSEVSKLKNSFNYGITSYNDSMTAMSSTINDNVLEEEPLWAIDPEDLSEISDASILIGENDLIGPDLELFDNYTQIKSTAYKEFYSLLDFENCPENKLCVYTKGILKTNGNISLELKDEDGNTLTIDLGNHISKNSFRNILIVLNRLVLNEDAEEFSGVNYLYLQVTDSLGNVLLNGYIDLDSIISDNIQYLNTRYYISKITFLELDLYKCNFYVKDSSFTNEGNGLSTLPDDSDFKFGAAHIAIRSVKTKEVLTLVSSRLLNNELVFVESENLLYIKNQNQIISLSSGSSIGGGGNNNNTMTEQEILEILKNAGIITADNELNSVKLNDIEQLTFTHSESGQKFNVHVNADGELLVDNITAPLTPDISTESKMAKRGAVGKYSLKSNYESTDTGQLLYGTSDNPLALGDRVRFGSWYIPVNNLTSFNCSHDFIELANSGTFDYPLENSRLYIVKGDILTIGSDKYLTDAKLYKFILKGVIKAGSTFVIRGKKHITKNEIITVDSYDYELRSYYVQNAPENSENLLEFTFENSQELFSLEKTLALILLNSNEEESLKLQYLPVENNTNNYKVSSFSLTLFTKITTKGQDFPPYSADTFNQLIDCVLLEDTSAFREGKQPNVFGSKFYTKSSDTLVKDSFELDPSRQGFLSLTTKNLESTNYRFDKINAEYVPLANKNISFFHTEDQFPISNYTPKASKYNKTICTDKTKLNIIKPNMVSCFYGINMLTTRCFNWVSVPERNEYVWIRKKGDFSWDNRFESYKGHSSELSTNNDVYDTGKMNRVKYTLTVINAAYKRLTGIFPGSNFSYCAHKCVVYIQDAPEDTPITYEYIVGPTLSNGQPNLEYTSNIQTFTLYPNSYTPLVYQISDQQGFNWIEYQVWAASAKQILKQINEECTEETKLFPVLINTGDCTQNGTRYNEWLDYYNAGYCLFDHLELLNVVGNNDLANAYNHSALGTGNDEGKSNPYYFHLVNCYEVDNSENYSLTETDYDKFWQHPLIVNGIFFPSTYYCMFDNFGYLLINSELTENTCRGLFKVLNNERVYNLYTGYLQNDSKLTKEVMYSKLNFANTIKNMLNKLSNKHIIVACHEMPFTVITEDYLKNLPARPGFVDRSCTCVPNSTNHSSLIGSHMNRLSFNKDWDEDNNYWFSDLLLSYGISLCIGGHKHSYTATYPIIEMNETLWASIESKIPSSEKTTLSLLQKDGQLDGQYNYSKLFLIIDDSIEGSSIKNLSSADYYPMFGCNSTTLLSILPDTSIKPVVYFMCQATGYKLKSNKELPSPNQKFSIIKPKTLVAESKAHFSLESPMFATIKHELNEFLISLYRIINIKTTAIDKITEFSFLKHSTKPMISEKLLMMKENNGNISNFWLVDKNNESKYDFSFTTGNINKELDRCWKENNNFVTRTTTSNNEDGSIIPSTNKTLNLYYSDSDAECTLKVKL